MAELSWLTPTPLPSLPEAYGQLARPGAACVDDPPTAPRGFSLGAKSQGVPFQTSARGLLPVFLPHAQSCPIPCHRLSPALIKSHIYVSQICTESPSKPSAPTWSQAGTTLVAPGFASVFHP